MFESYPSKSVRWENWEEFGSGCSASFAFYWSMVWLPFVLRCVLVICEWIKLSGSDMFVSFPLTPGSISCLVSGVTSVIREGIEESLVQILSPRRRIDILHDAFEVRLVANLTPWSPLEWTEWGNLPTWPRYAVHFSDYCTIQIILQ